ncbi:uroporphyrinogen-III synthase [Methylorubrum aminovorans]|nr:MULTISPECIES: uroporphyrinogen-III synthase [unclassified Methylobacterium]QIJ73674.1 uroporphyrinogen-III synthase [Methylobacterium sp. CLZ]QIJ78583.1 uroporphyrinogen-III synthase [Methylobacterium sp. NI91]
MRIWVSRPEPGAGRTARRLAELGHATLVAPVLRIGPGGEPPPAGRFDGLILTSANAAAPLAGAGFPAAPVFAVGRRTAERAERMGLRSVLCADGDAADLARLVAAHVRPGGALLHAAGEDRKPEPAASLTAEGYRVTTWTAYAALAEATLPGSAAQALAGRDDALPVTATLHFSRRSAEIAERLCREAGLSGAFRALAHYCLSPDVAAGLVELGIAAHFVAARPSEEALLAGLAASD